MNQGCDIMRVMFMGTTPFSCVVLDELLKNNYDVVAVVTQPDRPFGRKRILKASPVKEMAIALGIPVLQPEKIKRGVDEILSYQPDLIVTCAYGQIVPKIILDYPKYLCLNVHASLLPKFRGGAPIHWSIIRGETETGVTLMRMDVGMDSGDMLAKRSVPIEFTDTMGDVEAKLMDVSRELIRHDLRNYLQGKLDFVAQNPQEVTLAYTIHREDERIDFNVDALEVYNHIRGLIPWPVAHGILDGHNVKFHGVRWIDINHATMPGTILEVSQEGVLIACKKDAVCITKIQPFGKPVLEPGDFMNGIGREWKGKIFE